MSVRYLVWAVLFICCLAVWALTTSLYIRAAFWRHPICVTAVWTGDDTQSAWGRHPICMTAVWTGDAAQSAWGRHPICSDDTQSACGRTVFMYCRFQSGCGEAGQNIHTYTLFAFPIVLARVCLCLMLWVFKVILTSCMNQTKLSIFMVTHCSVFICDIL